METVAWEVETINKVRSLGHKIYSNRLKYVFVVLYGTVGCQTAETNEGDLVEKGHISVCKCEAALRSVLI